MSDDQTTPEDEGGADQEVRTLSPATLAAYGMRPGQPLRDAVAAWAAIDAPTRRGMAEYLRGADRTGADWRGAFPALASLDNRTLRFVLERLVDAERVGGAVL